MTYKLLLTQLGSQKIAAAATAGGTPLQITEFAVGQGVNVDFSSRLDKQVLVSKRYQAAVQGVAVVAGKANTYEITCIVPHDVGGFAIRELGLLDSSGDLIWVGALPEVQKPTADSTAAVDYRIKAVVTIDNADVTLVVDANVVTATQSWVESHHQKMMQLLIPFGYKYWSHSEDSPKPLFDELLGIETHWRRLKGVQLVAVDEADTHINHAMAMVGKSGDVSADNSSPDHYPLYTSYLWERYDPNNIPVRYDGGYNYDGTATYQ